MSNQTLDQSLKSLQFDLKDSLEYVVEHGGLLVNPDYSVCCDPENRIVLKSMFKYASGNHSWVTFQTAVMKHRGNFESFTNTKHWDWNQ